jgi:hypothetical protein
MHRALISPILAKNNERESAVRNVLIKLRRPADLATEMAEMRAWLDQQRYEPAKFTCDRYGDLLVIRAKFHNDTEADAFERRFDTPEGEPQSQLRLWKSPETSPDFTENDSGNAVVPETMAQVCWWRLMAEEIRTEADAFASASAKETMRIAAQTWDRMAEDLERRLSRGR